MASQAARPTGYPAVANMSLGGETNRAAEAAVRNSIRAQVTYVVAAGNWNSDAANYSPAAVCRGDNGRRHEPVRFSSRVL